MLAVAINNHIIIQRPGVCASVVRGTNLGSVHSAPVRMEFHDGSLSGHPEISPSSPKSQKASVRHGN